MHRGFVTSTKLLVFFALLVSLPALPGQQAQNEQDSTPSFGVGLAPGDTLVAHFIDFPEAANLPLTVSPSGTLFVPYVGQVKVQGMMPEEAEQAVAAALQAKQVVKSPQVSLTVVTARNLSVMVLGAVSNPRPIPLFSPAPLSFVLSQAGTVSTAASYHVLIAHRDGAPPDDVELDRTGLSMRGMNTVVRPGDVVSVAQAGSFFALGEFNHPGLYPLTGAQHMTLIQAISVAGGPDLYAGLSHARILRTVDGRREEIVVDLAKLHDGKVADPLVHTDDVIFIPRSNVKVVLNSWLS